MNVHALLTSYSLPEMEASATDSLSSCILLSAIMCMTLSTHTVQDCTDCKIQTMLISDLPSPQNLLTSAVLKSPALKHRFQRQTWVPDASEGLAAVLLWYLALQTALVNRNLPSLDGSHGHIKSSVFENKVRRHELLCPASVVNHMVAVC